MKEFKNLKINKSVFDSLKEYLKDKNMFLQDFVEGAIYEAIKNNSVKSMQNDIKKYEKYLTIFESLSINQFSNKTMFKIEDNVLKEFLKELEKHGKLEDYYFNIPTYDNVKIIKLKPYSNEGVIKFLEYSRVDGYPIFRVLENINEHIETLLKDESKQNSTSLKISKDAKFKYDVNNVLHGKELENNFSKIVSVKTTDLNESFIEFLNNNTDIKNEKIVFYDNTTENDFLKLVKKHIRPNFDVLVLPSKYKIYEDILKVLGLEILIDDKIDSIYSYAKSGFICTYNFKNCNSKEVRLSFGLNASCIVKIDLQEEISTDIFNASIIEDLKVLDFIKIKDDARPEALKHFEIVLGGNEDIGLKDELHGLDIFQKSLNIGKNELLQNIIRSFLTNNISEEDEICIDVGNDFYGFDLTKKVFDKIKDECTNGSIIILGGVLGVAFLELNLNNSIKSDKNKNFLSCIGDLNGTMVYVDPYMRFNDTTCLIIDNCKLYYDNDILKQISYDEKLDKLILNSFFNSYKNIKKLNFSKYFYDLM